MTPLSLETLPEFLPEAVVIQALTQDTTVVGVLAKNKTPQAGDLIGVRLNLNVLASTKLAIQTIHAGTNTTGYRKGKGFYRGEAVSYAQAVLLKDAYFNVSQSGREAIATGQQHKFAMASVDGELQNFSPAPTFQGLPLRFNPKAGHLFTDGEGFAVQSAEEVVIMGHRAYARGLIHYYTEDTAPQRAGTAPSNVRFKLPHEADLVVDTVSSTTPSHSRHHAKP